jgi:hypothetical protein
MKKTLRTVLEDIPAYSRYQEVYALPVEGKFSLDSEARFSAKSFHGSRRFAIMAKIVEWSELGYAPQDIVDEANSLPAVAIVNSAAYRRKHKEKISSYEATEARRLAKREYSRAYRRRRKAAKAALV